MPRELGARRRTRAGTFGRPVNAALRPSRAGERPGEVDVDVDAEVVIAGACFAGLATARALQGRDVLIVDPHPLGTFETSAGGVPPLPPPWREEDAAEPLVACAQRCCAARQRRVAPRADATTVTIGAPAGSAS